MRRRRVFYIPGYDPFHPRRYRELYRREGAEQARVCGYEIALSPRQGGGAYGWKVAARIDGAEIASEFEVLVWSDLVRGSMGGSISGTYLHLLRTTWVYVSTGALRRLMWLRRGPVLAALYPIVVLLAQLAVALGLGALAGAGLAAAAAAVPGAPAWAGLPGWLALPAVAVAVLRWFKAKDGRFFAYYLMHDYAYAAATRGANPPDLEARMARFADAIAAALAEGAEAPDGPDEVLVVGHSSGAHIAVSVLADLLRAGRVPAQGLRQAGAAPGATRAPGPGAAQGTVPGAAQGTVPGPAPGPAPGPVAGSVAGPVAAGKRAAEGTAPALAREMPQAPAQATPRGTPQAPGRGPALSFLSLGQVVPMVSFLPEARRLRADLAYLSTRPELSWIDVTAPGDSCAFALCDPVAVSGVAPRGKRWPLVISAAFSQTLSPERWKALRWRFFRLHFQYLCAFDRPGGYDYFRITAGPQTLGAQFAGRAPSRLRIETAVSKHVSTSA